MFFYELLLLIFNIEHFSRLSNHLRDFFRKIFSYKKDIYLYRMKKLNTNGLFDIFPVGEYLDATPILSPDISFTLFCRVIKGVEYFHILDMAYSSKKINLTEERLSLCDSIKLEHFNNLYDILHRVEEIQSDTVESLSDELGLENIAISLQSLLDYYQEKEFYEKCSVIFKFYQLFFKK
jgi:hypothetical protein